MLTIEPAVTDPQLNDVRKLMREYAVIRNYDAALGDFEEEQARLAIYFGQPRGLILLARWHGSPAGCVAFRPLEPGVCEMKRLFVSPDFRNHGIGRAMIGELIKNAVEKDYRIMRLDSHPWMEAAHRLYQSFGFREIARYNDNPTPGIRFFELALAPQKDELK